MKYFFNINLIAVCSYFPSHEESHIRGPVDCVGGLLGSVVKTGGNKKDQRKYNDPSEPIYTDPNLFEK